ncbi:MAG: enoyl-CoA hydratase-related protein [Polyangiales bacterium]
MSLLLVEDHGAVRVLTLNRPEKKNALNEPLAAALTEALEVAADDADVHVVVVVGSEGTFCAGADVHLFLEAGRGGKVPEVVVNIHEALRAFPKPLIAGVEGLAVGMGVTLLPHFDMVYANRSAKLYVPFARLGLVVEYGSSFTLPRLIGRQRANELVLRGKPVDATTAADWGLVTRVFEDAEFRERVLEVAADVGALPSGAVRASKALLREGEERTLDEAIADEADVLSGLYGSEENIRAVEAFLNRAARSRPS